jgi:ABC-type Fe3+/spermidine/putrescine transport system ATPase subunit
MRAGEIVQTGKAKEIFYKPRTVFAAKFLGYENVFEAKLVKSDGGFSDFDVEGVRLRAEGKVDGDKRMIAIRPEDIVVKPSSMNDVANTFQGTITDCSDMGSVVMVTLDIGIMLKSLMTKSFFVEGTLEVGREVCLRFNAGSVKILE